MVLLGGFAPNLPLPGFECSVVVPEWRVTCFVINDLWRPADVMTLNVREKLSTKKSSQVHY